jgi:protein-disulfide isomerase
MAKTDQTNKKTLKKMSKSTMTLSIFIAGLIVVFGAKFMVEAARHNASQAEITKVKGNKNAPIKIIEFIDFQCPACAAGAKMLREYFTTHPDKIYLEMKYYPLGMHSHAYQSSEYAECALKQGKFWPFHDLLIDRQGEWSILTDAKPAFETMAKETGMNMNDLQSCLADVKTREAIAKNKEEGTALGVQSTPSYLVNGKFVVGFKNLQAELDTLLAK